MVKNKITMRDVARECNVSVATVSYVLNHSEKEKISHDTCLKVKEAAMRLHYIPSSQDTSFKEHKSNLVGIIINLKEHNTPGKKLLYYDLAAELINNVRLLGFDAVIITTKDLEKDVDIIIKHSLDAVFMIDIDNRIVEKITQDYYVPIIFLNCEVNDKLFCKIYPDYPDLFEKAKSILQTDNPFLVMEDIYSQNLKEQITKWFHPKDVFINVPDSDLPLFLQVHGKSKGIVLGDILSLQVQRFISSENLVSVSCLGNTDMLLTETPTLFIRNKNMAAIAVKTLQSMLRLEYNSHDENRIMIKCELK